MGVGNAFPVSQPTRDHASGIISILEHLPHIRMEGAERYAFSLSSGVRRNMSAGTKEKKWWHRFILLESSGQNKLEQGYTGHLIHFANLLHLQNLIGAPGTNHCWKT
ncbi:unnamed protein product [Caretta caretta]